MATKKIGASIVLEGNREYNRAIKEISASQKELTSEMNLVSETFVGQQNSVDALTKKQQILSKQLEEQSKKVDKYSEALAKSKEMEDEAVAEISLLSSELNAAKEAQDKAAKSFGEGSTSYESASKKVEELEQRLKNANAQQTAAETSIKNWQTSLNYAEADLKKLNREVENNAKYLDEAKNSTTGTAHSIDETGKVIKETGEKAEKTGKQIKDIFTGTLIEAGAEKLLSKIWDIGKGLVELGANAAYAADEIATMAVKTGLTTDTLQELEYASELMDTSLDTVTGAMTKNINAMDKARDGTEKYASVYENLGIKITDANGNLRDSEEVFWEAIDALGNIENATERDALAMDLFGKSAQELNPLIQTGSEGFAKLAQEAKDVGYVLEENTLDGLLSVSDSIERASKKMDALKRQIGADVAPSIENSINKLTDTFAENEAAIVGNISELIEEATEIMDFVLDNEDEIMLFGSVALPMVAVGFAGVKIAAAEAAMAEKGYTAQSLISATAAAARTIASKGLVAGLKEEIAYLNASATAALGFNAALLLIPAAAAAVVAAIGVGYAKSIEENAIKPTVELSEANKNLYNSYHAIIEQQSQTAQTRTADRESVMQNVNATQSLVAELKVLQSQSDLTAEEQEKQADIVRQLNAQYPDLELAIDETTGALNKSIDAIEDSIEAMLRQQMVMAAQEDLQEIAAEQYEITKQQTEAERELADALEALGIAYDGVNGVYAETLIQMHEAGEVADEQYYQVGALMASYRDLGNQQEELRGQYADTVSWIEETTGAMDDQAEAENNLLTKTVELGNGMQISIQGSQEDISESIDKIVESYNKAYESAKSSIEGQVGLFDELKISSDTSASQMAANLQSQTEAFNQYARDIETCRQLVEKGLLDEGILGAIEEMGMNGAGYMHELATATENEIADIQQNFAAMEEAKESLAQIMSTINEDYLAALGEMNDSTEVTMYSITDVVSGAMVDQVAAVEENGIAMVSVQQDNLDEMHGSTLAALGMADDGDISTVYQSIGQQIPESVAAGVTSNSSTLYQAVGNMILGMADEAVGAIEDASARIVAAMDRAMGELLD